MPTLPLRGQLNQGVWADVYHLLTLKKAEGQRHTLTIMNTATVGKALPQASWLLSMACAKVAPEAVSLLLHTVSYPLYSLSVQHSTVVQYYCSYCTQQ